MENWVILFARTGSEDKLVHMLRERLNGDEYLPFVPVKEMPYRNRGIIQKMKKPLFPGYIFLKTNVEPALILDKLKLELTSVQGVYSILHYGSDKYDVVLNQSERFLWERLFDRESCIRGSEGFIEGDKIQITSGALMGIEGRIKKINRHKREATVEMELMGATRDVVLMLEITKKI